MAYTEVQWNRLQASLPAEDRIPYDVYLASQGAPSETTTRLNAAEAANAQNAADTIKALQELGVGGSTTFTQPMTIAGQTKTAATAAETADEYVTNWRSGLTAKKGTALYDLYVKQNAEREVRDAAYANKPTEDPGEGYYWGWQERNQKWVRIKSTGFGTTATGPTGGGGNNGSTGSVTQSSIDAAVASALATQQAKFDALVAQQKAEADAAKLALKVKASDKLKTMLAAYGLEGLAGFIDRRIMADASEEQVMLELYDQPEYQQRFSGMASLRKKGRTITEKEYMDIENAMVQTARFFDLPKGFYDSPDDFGKLIGNEVSAKEYQDRLQVGQDLARGLNPAIKTELINLYNVGEGDITAYVLDSDRALPLIQKQAKAAQFVGLGRSAGFKLGGITAGQAENIAGTESYAKLSQAELTKALGAAGQLRRTQERLANLEGVAYNEQEALSAVIEGSPEALLASQQRAQREAARFSTRGGVTGSSLRSTTQF